MRRIRDQNYTFLMLYSSVNNRVIPEVYKVSNICNKELNMEEQINLAKL